MSLTLVGKQYYNAHNVPASTVQVTLPAGLRSGDALFMAVLKQKAFGDGSAIASVPSGWSDGGLGLQDFAFANRGGTYFYKIANGTEGASQAVVITGAGDFWDFETVCLRGAGPLVIDGFARFRDTLGSPKNLPSVTTSLPNVEICHSYQAAFGGATSRTWPAGFTDLGIDAGDNGFQSFAIGTKATAGATSGQLALNPAPDGNFQMATLALRNSAVAKRGATGLISTVLCG